MLAAVKSGCLGLMKINPDGYKMVSTFKITTGSGKYWAHPAVSDGRLYMRHGEVLMCYDVKAR